MISPSVVRWRASGPVVRSWLPRTAVAAAALLFVAAVGSAQPAPPPSGTAAPQEVMGAGETAGILGRPVVDPGGRPLGRVVDVLVDGTGQPRAIDSATPTTMLALCVPSAFSQEVSGLLLTNGAIPSASWALSLCAPNDRKSRTSASCNSRQAARSSGVGAAFAWFPIWIGVIQGFSRRRARVDELWGDLACGATDLTDHNSPGLGRKRLGRPGLLAAALSIRAPGMDALGRHGSGPKPPPKNARW